MVKFGVYDTQTWSCPRSDLEYPKFDLGDESIWDMDHPKSKFQFGMTEIELPIWDIPSLIWDMVEFGLQQ